MSRERTTGEIMALPPAERAKAWQEVEDRIFAASDAAEQAYLDGDYAKVGSRKATDFGE